MCPSPRLTFLASLSPSTPWLVSTFRLHYNIILAAASHLLILTFCIFKWKISWKPRLFDWYPFLGDKKPDSLISLSGPPPTFAAEAAAWGERGCLMHQAGAQGQKDEIILISTLDTAPVPQPTLTRAFLRFSLRIINLANVANTSASLFWNARNVSSWKCV